MDDFAKVSMLELDRSLTRILTSAQSGPVSVHRYGTPWVWVVSHDTWIKVNRRDESLPERHPLAALRRHLEAESSRHQDILRSLADASELGRRPEPLLRAIVLTELYGIHSDRFLDEQLRHNALFAAFVGLDEPDWDALELSRQLQRLRAQACVQALLERLLERAPLHRFVGELGLPPPRWAHPVTGGERAGPAR